MGKGIDIAFVGDIMPGGVLYGDEGIHISDAVVSALGKADMRVGNLECAVGPFTDAPTFDPEKMARKKDIVWAVDEDLKRVEHMRMDVLCLANNHIFDLGAEGLRHTLAELDRRSILHCGAGMNLEEASRPAVMKVGGKSVAVLSFCDYRDETVGYVPFATKDNCGVNPLYPMSYSTAEVRKYKQTYDYVYVVPHWGLEGTWVATESVIRDAKALIDAGADAVVGGHPHRIQSPFMYRGKPIFPSLGNFFFPDRYLNSPRPTWYPPKGSDTSGYPRTYGYPYVSEPTLKLWPKAGRIGMIGYVEAGGHLDSRLVCLDDENSLNLVTDVRGILGTRVYGELAVLRFLYRFDILLTMMYACKRVLKKVLRRK